MHGDEHRGNLPGFEGTAGDEPLDEQAAGEHGKDGGGMVVGLCHHPVDR